MTDEKTLEDLQAELLALREEQETLKAAVKNKDDEIGKLQQDLGKARELNSALISKVPGPSGQPAGEEDPYAGMSDEEAFIAMIPDIVDDAASKLQKARFNDRK